MKSRTSIFILSLLFLLLVSSGCIATAAAAPSWPGAGSAEVRAPAAAAEDTADCAVAVTDPRSGQEVASRVDAAGTAKLPPNHHLWLFARRVSYRPLELWWPQGEAVVEHGKWKMPVAIGNFQDVGWEFDVTAAVFDQEQHLKLRDYFRNAIKVNDYQPIEMPAALCVAKPLVVKKTRQ